MIGTQFHRCMKILYINKYNSTKMCIGGRNVHTNYKTNTSFLNMQHICRIFLHFSKKWFENLHTRLYWMITNYFLIESSNIIFIEIMKNKFQQNLMWIFFNFQRPVQRIQWYQAQRTGQVFAMETLKYPWTQKYHHRNMYQHMWIWIMMWKRP